MKFEFEKSTFEELPESTKEKIDLFCRHVSASEGMDAFFSFFVNKLVGESITKNKEKMDAGEKPDGEEMIVKFQTIIDMADFINEHSGAVRAIEEYNKEHPEPKQA